MNRARVFFSAAAALAVLTLGLRAQVASTPYSIIEGLGLPAVELGALRGEPRTSGVGYERTHKAAAAARAAQIRVGRSGNAYTRGKVIVKFRDGARPADAIGAAGAGAVLLPRPAYADFDLVAIDANADAEAVADALGSRPDVEYAQASYVAHTLLVPNDVYYKELQWNLPLINMESAWDIQPQAGSSIVVAVIDTGMAYT